MSTASVNTRIPLQGRRIYPSRSVTVRAEPKLPAGKRFAVERLPKPMGMVLGESPTHTVVVEEVKSGGPAASAGIQIGDVIMEVSAVTLKAGKEGVYESEGYGQRPFDNFEKSMMSCAGQSFDVVMSAIASNNPRWGYNTVDLVILRPDKETE